MTVDNTTLSVNLSIQFTPLHWPVRFPEEDRRCLPDIPALQDKPDA